MTAAAPNVNRWTEPEWALRYLGERDTIPHRVEGLSVLMELVTPMPAPPAPGAKMEPPMQTALVQIEGIGAAPYKVEWNFMMRRPSPVQPPDATARAAQPAGPPPDKIFFDSDGAHPVMVTIIKSKSNISNN